MSIDVAVIREASHEVVEALGRLLPQLSTHAEFLGHEAVSRIVHCDANTVLIARLNEEIVGTLTLVMLPLPSGLRARVEDVVVDVQARGQGVAQQLIRHAIQLACEAGVRTLDLTSRPDRETANRLYEKLGFAARNSTVYRFEASQA
ncbi:GNAT family N-acetyltransferase [Streptomyces sp. NPDC014684]|uniref:GNAT family N-acetyltransferase n=1 Tax=Streptomyces sp. NPDC014684 TaxID=3364880 RepID=UPI0036FCF3D7